MANRIQEKFDGYHKVIKSNIEIIEELIEQFKQLNELIVATKDTERKEKIGNIQGKLQSSISNLLNNTVNLYKRYDRLLDEYARIY